MIDMGDFRNSRIFRTGCVVMTSTVSFMASCGEVRHASAGWPAFPAGRKASSSDTTKSPKGFATTIHKLLKEAKQLEARGDFDQAISVAERATVIAEKTKDLNKSAPDISPEATSRYVSELKRKKAEVRNKKWQIARREPKRAAPVEQAPLDDVDSIFDADIALNDVKAEFDLPIVATLKPTAPEASDFETDASDPSPSLVEALPLTKPQLRSRFVGQEFANRKAEPLPVTATASADMRWETPQSAAPRTMPQRDEELAPLSNVDLQAAETTASSKSIYDLLEDEVQFLEPIVRHPLNESPQELSKAPAIVDETEIQPAQLETQETVVSSVTQTIEEEIAVSRSRSISKRIQLRPRFAATEQLDLTAAFPVDVDVDADSTGPTIESWTEMAKGNKSDAPLPFDPMLDESHIRPVAATWEWEAEPTGLASIKPEPATSKDNKGAPRQLEDQTSTTERPWYDDSEDEFPSHQVHELKQRLESALSLQPGDIAKSATIDLLSERLIDESEEESFVEDSTARNDAAPTEDYGSLFETESESAHLHVTHGHISTRTPIVGQTSMIRWRAANAERDGSAAQKRMSAKSTELPLDLRQSLREGAQLEALSESGMQSLFSLPTVKLRSTASSALDRSADSSSDPSAGSTLTARTEVRGSLWDNATAPTIEGYSGSIIGRPEPRTAAAEDRNSAPLPPPVASVAQTSFDSPDAVHGQFGQMKSPPQSPAQPGAASRLDNSVPPIEPSMESAGKRLPVKKASLKSRSDAAADDATASSQALHLNGPIERLAFVLGITTSTTSTALGIIGLAMAISGLWTVRTIVRSSLKQYDRE